MNEFVQFIDGWKKLILQMTAWERVIFAVACVFAMVVGITIGMQPSAVRIKGVKAGCESNDIIYYTSGQICAPYREAFGVGKKLLLESRLSGQCYCFKIPYQTAGIYIPDTSR